MKASKKSPEVQQEETEGKEDGGQKTEDCGHSGAHWREPEIGRHRHMRRSLDSGFAQERAPE